MLEGEVFLLGMWKNFEELEENISMPELLNILDSKRRSDHNEHKFFAAIQGIDLEKNTSNDEWERLRDSVFEEVRGRSGNDIVSLQGMDAQVAGFGIGHGLDYEVFD